MATDNTPLTGPIRPGLTDPNDLADFGCDSPALRPLSNDQLTAILEAHGLHVEHQGTNLYAVSPYTRRDPSTNNVTRGDQFVCVTGWSTRTIRRWLGY